MKKIVLTIMILLQGVLVAQEVSQINVNGVEIPVVFEKDTSLPIASVQLVVKNAGSMEDGTNEGIAKFLAAMLGEGTKEIGATAFAEELEFRAISLGAHSGVETLVFEVSAL